DVYNMAKDYALFAKGQGVTLDLEALTDEKIASENFKTGQCDMLVATSFRTRPYNTVAGSLDALGAASVVKDGKVDMPLTYEVVHRAIELFATKKADNLMTNGNYQVAGIVPFGAAYLYVKDRSINSVDKLAGKKIASFDYDSAQKEMISKVGASPVSADISNFGAKFNNGSVDIIAAPAAAYKPLELYKGLGTKGAIVRFPVAVLTYQLILNKTKFPDGFAQKSREYWAGKFDQGMKIIHNAEKGIPSSAWMDIPAADSIKYTVLLRESRVALSKAGSYDPRTLNIMKQIRCGVNRADSECATPKEL
ncbi:MAG TPA: putative solute-binding protein, partial [Limnobacter sp.]|uniref:putative solute-binding protein n=1 Tax=Limnobacter sp. TaxID=2003368 RepID=UPI002E35A592